MDSIYDPLEGRSKMLLFQWIRWFCSGPSDSHITCYELIGQVNSIVKFIQQESSSEKHVINSKQNVDARH